MKRVLLGMTLAMLLTSMLMLPYNVERVSASGTIYIRADGSIDPPSTPLFTSDNTNYYFTGNINDSIVVERNNTRIHGNGYTLQGSGSGNGFYLSGISNVEISDTTIKNFGNGIRAVSGSDNLTVVSNKISNCSSGIIIITSNDDKILNNEIRLTTSMGIGAIYVQNLIVQSNIIANGWEGMELGGSGCTIIGNIISNNSESGIYAGGSVPFNWGYSNVIELNDILNNGIGFLIDMSQQQAFHDNSIYHNNIANNTQQVVVNGVLGANDWDDGYPSGGNYWSDYNGTDLFRGAYQNITGNDGIGDTSYFINSTNSDRYPLTTPSMRTEPGTNVTVCPLADVGLTFDSVTRTGSVSAYKTDTLPEWMPPLSGLVGEYVDVTVTAVHIGGITVAITYDDSNMTQEQENSLQLLQWSGCDVTGPIPGVLDGVVNMRDIGAFASHFLVPGGSDAWDPRYDVTGPTPGVPDGVVNMRDIGEACSHFMGTNSWTDITTYVDTVNNIIYGETTHFSMFGVTRW